MPYTQMPPHYVVGLTQTSISNDLHDKNVMAIISDYFKPHTQMPTSPHVGLTAELNFSTGLTCTEIQQFIIKNQTSLLKFYYHLKISTAAYKKTNICPPF